MIRNLLLASVAIVPLSAPAFAACSDAKPSSGATVTCTGTDTKGVKNSDADGVSVTVVSGATVSNSAKTDNHTIHLDADADLKISGTVISTSAKDAIHLGDDASIALTGATITTTNSESDAIQADSGLSLTIDATSTITAGKKGVNGGDGDGSTVVNYGKISAGGEGVELGDDGSVTNYGTIEALDDALNTGEHSTILNYGTLHSKSDSLGIDYVQDAIDLDSGTIENYGTILSDDDAAIDFDATKYTDEASVITNAGLIQGASGIIVETGHNDDGTSNGEAANEASQVVINSGSIIATSGPVLKLGAGDDSYEGLAGSILSGTSLLGEGNDTFTISTGATAGDVYLGTGNDSLIITDALTTGSFSLFDGGEGTDVVSFLAYASTDLLSYSWTDSLLGLTFSDGLVVSLLGFESYVFTDVTLTAADLPAVPVPAPALMLLSGLAGFGLLRRRR